MKFVNQMSCFLIFTSLFISVPDQRLFSEYWVSVQGCLTGVMTV